jgi:hypothetical protein
MGDSMIAPGLVAFFVCLSFIVALAAIGFMWWRDLTRCDAHGKDNRCPGCIKEEAATMAYLQGWNAGRREERARRIAALARGASLADEEEQQP